jgi:hypothetical protein
VLEIANRTPFCAALAPSLDKHGVDFADVVVKATYAVTAAGQVSVAEAQVPILEVNEHAGDPATSGIVRAADLGPAKTGTDVVLLGHAYAPRGRARSADVGLQVGPVRKVVRVLGERRWVRSLGAWVASDPVEFERIPLVWERAYGGRDESDAKKPAFEPRNPAGTGFAASSSKERLEGLALPNLEDPRDLVRSWNTRPAPAGFGFVAPSWVPRSRYAGTYDAAWEEDRLPLLPDDFDERFHSTATAELQARPHLLGGEPVRVVGATLQGDLTFALPRPSFQITVWLRGQPSKHRPLLDTVVVEPDDGRVVLTYRASVPCPRRFLQLEAILVEEARS